MFRPNTYCVIYRARLLGIIMMANNLAGLQTNGFEFPSFSNYKSAPFQYTNLGSRQYTQVYILVCGIDRRQSEVK